ncbi:MAG: hypothetical protein LPK03_16135 [Pontibacter sp.]|nr:hypothetical protein [Pontibacter sp.]
MELGTITQIRASRDRIREKIKAFDSSRFTTQTFGPENEYTSKGLIGGIDSLLTDISTLTKWQNKFVKLSTQAERNNILQYLNYIDTYFDTPSNYISHFEALKVLVRSYNVRTISERQVEFEKEIENVLKLKLQLQAEMAEVEKIKDSIGANNSAISESFDSSKEKLSEIEAELASITDRKDELATITETLSETKDEILQVKVDAENTLSEIKASMTESKSNEKLITSFANKVQERDKRLSELEQNTIENNTKLEEYEKERTAILEQAKALIKSAKEALNYKTAEGISASFHEHYLLAKNRWIIAGWIIGAILCLLGALGIGIWILKSNTMNLGLIIGRISLLPLPIIGAVFCANQYTKQKNIIEDYAYKMVLSKSIVGFSEQLKKNATGDNTEYVHYIKTALEEIHKDPLRRREVTRDEKGNNHNLRELVDVAERIVKISKAE